MELSGCYSRTFNLLTECTISAESTVAGEVNRYYCPGSHPHKGVVTRLHQNDSLLASYKHKKK